MVGHADAVAVDVRKGMNGREERIKGANGETGSTNADAAMTESIDFGFTCKREKKIVHGGRTDGIELPDSVVTVTVTVNKACVTL
jgi:hypothetical protein